MIVVFGSINVDLICQVDRIAKPGETVVSSNYTPLPGGKGANQALAAQRAGATVQLLGAVGEDNFANLALSLLANDGVKLRQIPRLTYPTGIAMITVDSKGENAITVVRGANSHAKAETLQIIDLQPGDIVLIQCELPNSESLLAARIARDKGARVIVNFSPALALNRELLAVAHILIVNEQEAIDLAAYIGLPEKTPRSLARALELRFCLATIVTLGGNGVYARLGREIMTIEAPWVDVVDTTGAGDAFTGAFASALDQGYAFKDALVFATCASSLACTKLGAQPSLPYHSDIKNFYAKFSANVKDRA